MWFSKAVRRSPPLAYIEGLQGWRELGYLPQEAHLESEAKEQMRQPGREEQGVSVFTDGSSKEVPLQPGLTGMSQSPQTKG